MKRLEYIYHFGFSISFASQLCSNLLSNFVFSRFAILQAFVFQNLFLFMYHNTRGYDKTRDKKLAIWGELKTCMKEQLVTISLTNVLVGVRIKRYLDLNCQLIYFILSILFISFVFLSCETCHTSQQNDLQSYPWNWR